jgi:hypothetical protein
LRELALIAGGNPKTFYHGVNPDDLDLEGQDVQGIEFTNVATEHMNKIRGARAKEERLTMLLDRILQDRSNALQIVENYGVDKSKYANASVYELWKALKKESEHGKIDNVSLVRALRRPLAHQLGDSRANLLYYMAKHLAKYPDIRMYLRKSLARSTSTDLDRYRRKIDKFMA